MSSSVNDILNKVIKENRKNLNEVEVYEIFKFFSLDVPEFAYAEKEKIDEQFVEQVISKIKSEKVVLKIVSSKNLHKTDSGGVKIVNKDFNEVKSAIENMKKNFPDTDGIVAVEFIPHSPFSLGEELLLGLKFDEAFGYVIMIAPGGTHTESFMKAINRKFAPFFISLDSIKGEDDIKSIIDKVWILNYCFGKVRGLKKLAEENALIKWIYGFKQIVESVENSEIIIDEMEINPLALSNGKFYSLDGVLRFSHGKKNLRDIPSKEGILSILKPKSIAIIGVSEKKMNMGRIILNNTIKAGFDVNKIYVIKGGVDEIDGAKCYKSVFDVPENIDMYVISVPSENVLSVVEDAAKSNKVNGIVLITGGVGEKSGTENIAERIKSTVVSTRKNKKEFCLNGGNCMGIVLNNSKVNTFFIPEYKMDYPTGKNPHMVKTAFVSQSGAFVISTLTKIPHIIPDYTITVGNQQDITVVDYLDVLVDEDVELILTYIEGFKPQDGKRLINIIKKANTSGKKVVIYKAGRTLLGQKAVMGHTASIAGNYTVTQKLLEEAGAIVCEDFDEFCDMAYLSSYLMKYRFKNRKIFMMSNAGFETTGMADNLSFFDTEIKNEETVRNVNEVLKKYRLDSIVDFKNPMDITPMANDMAISEIIENILKDKDFSLVCASMVPLTPNMNTVPKNVNLNSPDDLEKSFIKNVSDMMKTYEKPVILCVASGNLYSEYVKYAVDKGFVVFRSADRMMKMLEKYFINGGF